MSHKSTDVKTPGIVAIAKKWKLPVAKVMELVNQGAEVEKEHNKSIVKARQVARDHINERPDYYSKLKKMEKTPVSVKEETGVSGVRGLGYVTGDPGVDPVQSYIDTNSMSYDDLNGNILQLIRDKHSKFHKNMGFGEYTPNDIQNNLKESKHPLQVNFDKYRKGKLNELGGSDEPNAYTGLTDTPPRERKELVKEGPKLDKAKKIAMAGMTAANMYTLSDVAGRATEGGHGSPKGDIVRAATAAPGAFGWGATALHYGNKGYKLAKQALKSKKDKMEEESIKEDLRKWFREKWVRYDTKGNIKGPCAREEGEGKPKCRPLASARAMSKDERAKSARRKRREDPVADRPGKGGKPIMVNTNEETLLEKNVPTNPSLWARAKAQAKAKFDVYPSAYANGWASKWYKSKGGGWKSAANESVDEACWDTHKQVGWKKKGKKMVPDCVPKEEVEIDEVAAWQRKEGKNPEGGLNRKGIASYRRENPGSKLSMAVTTKPSKLKPGSKAAKRRKSFCARMGGMPGPMKDEKGRPTRKALSLRKWNCEEETQMKESATMAALAAGSALGAAAAPHINKAVGKGLDWLEKKRKQKHQDHYEKKSRKDVKEDNALPQTTQRGIYEKAPPGTKYERMVRHIKDRLGADGLTDKEKGIAFATAWKAYNKKHMKEDGFDTDAVSHAIRDKESGTSGGYNAKSKSSSASGAYQYINKTWKGSASKYGVDTKQFPTAKSAPKEVQDKVFMNDLQKNANKYGGLEKAVNVHYTGNPGGKVSAAGLKANRGQTGGGYMDDIKKRVDDYNTERKSTMGAAQQMAANFSGGSKSLSTPDSTQFAKAPEAPKPTQVASAPETPKMQNPDQNITKVASAPAPTQVSQLDTKDKKQIAEISDTLVGKMSNARFFRGEAPSERLERYIKRAQLRDPEEKKEKPKKKIVKEFWMPFLTPHHKHSARLSKKLGNKPDLIVDRGGEKGETKFENNLKEELQMENQNLINEALENILENNLNDMKENLLAAINEKAMEKLEERKKAIAADYFAQ